MLRHLKKSNRQQQAEADVRAFQQALGPFVTAAETTRMPMMFTDAKQANHPITFVNQAFLNLTGYQEDELLGQSFDALLEHHGTDPEMLAELQTAFNGGRDLEAAVRYRLEDGNTIWVTVNIAPVRDATGDVVQYFASFVNVTAQRQEADLLRAEVKDLNDLINKLGRFGND